MKIVGYDGVPLTESGESLPEGRPLFPPYQTSIDLPKQAAEQNFEIPKPAP